MSTTGKPEVVNATGGKPMRRSRWKWYLLLMFVGLLLLLGAGLWYTTTEAFQSYVRRHIVAALERTTGGRVELGAYHTIPFHLQVEIRDLTIHGLEAADQVPLAHVDSVVARIKVISLLQTQFGFDSVVLDHPVVHLIVYPDGTTNQPEPKVRTVSTKTPIEQVFALNISEFVVRRGEFLWNDQKIPLDFDVKNVSADMSYQFFRRRYNSHVVLGKVDSRIQDYRPFSWTAATEFSLGQQSVQVRSLTWSSGRSHVEFNGLIRDFQHPRIEGNYTASLDLEEAAGILRLPQVRKGLVSLQGLGTWSAERYSTSGKLELKDGEYRDSQINVPSVNLGLDFALDDKMLHLMRAQGKVFGGTVAGEAELTNWLASLEAPPGIKSSAAKEAAKEKEKPKKPEEPKGVVKLRVKDISAAAVAAAFSGPNLHLERLNLDAVTEGTIEARWKGRLRNFETDFALSMTPPARSAASHLPVTAHARGTYRLAIDELQLAQLDLATRATQLRASGTLAENSTLRLSATTSDLQELQPLITNLGGPRRLPVRVHGSGSFNGTASGKVTSAALAGHLQVSDFETLLPAQDSSSEQAFHWDTMSGDVQLSPDVVALRRVTAQHGDASLRGEASVTLSHWSVGSQSPFTASADVEGADIAELMALAGYSYPVTGRVNALVQASGTQSAPHASGHVHLSDAVAYGEPISQLDSDFQYAGGEATLNNLRVMYRDAVVSGGAAYNPATRGFRLNVTGTNIDLQRIPQLEQSRVLVEGRADFTAQGAGTLDEPVVNAKIHFRDLTFDHERAGNLDVDAVTQGADLHLTARSDFEHAEFDLSGTVRLRGDYPTDVTVNVDHFDVDALLHTYLRGRITGHSSVVGRIQARGALRRPRQFTATAEISGLSTDLSNIKIQNQDPVRLTLANETLRIEQLHLVGDGTDFTAHGTAVLSGARDLDLAAQGRIDLNLLQTLSQDFLSSGRVDVTLAVTGPMADPQLRGRVQVEHGAISYAGLPSGLSDMNGSLVFNKNQLQVESLTAHSGGGTLTLTGQATTYAGQLNFDFGAEGDDIRLRYPPGVSSTASAQLRFYGTPEASTLSGDINVTKLAITPGFDFSAYAGRSQSVVVPPATSPLYRIKLDVHVTTAADLQMQTAVARLTGAADLRVRGTAAKPAVLGRVDVLEGDISFNGARYRLERGEVMFTSPVSVQPILDLQASTRVRDYDITVSVNGSTDKPLNIKYRSDPPLPEADIVALLAVGQTREESAQMSQSQAGFSQTASNMILSEAINATVSNRVQRLFGISKIKIDPQGLSTETNPTRGPQVTIEQQISNIFTLTYSQNVSQASQQIIQGEYYVRRNVSIVGTRDQNGVVSFDVKIRQRKK